MVPIPSGSGRQISTSPPSISSAVLSASPGASNQPQIKKMATPIKATASVKASPPNHPVRASPKRDDSDSGGSSGDLAPLGNLDDMDEFPPLNHTSS